MVNKKAIFDYEVVERIEVGLVLTGAEVKSIRGGSVNLQGARAVVMNDGLWVVGMHVQKYAYATDDNYDPTRRKKLLLKKSELIAIEAKRLSAGLTLIPISVYNKGSLIKLELGLVRGKKKFEKREILKKRTEEQSIARMLKK